jgi:hypothetical protein
MSQLSTVIKNPKWKIKTRSGIQYAELYSGKILIASIHKDPLGHNGYILFFKLFNGYEEPPFIKVKTIESGMQQEEFIVKEIKRIFIIP